jgi:hypothetical protein
MEIVVYNKAPHFAQSYSQINGFDYGEKNAHVSRLEVVHTFLSYDNHDDITLYQWIVQVLSMFVGLGRPRTFERMGFRQY